MHMRYTKKDRRVMKMLCDRGKMIFKFTKKLETKVPGYDVEVILLPREDWEERCRLVDTVAKQLKTKYVLD